MQPDEDDSKPTGRNSPRPSSEEDGPTNGTARRPATAIPDDLESRLDALTASELRAVVDYVRSRIPTRRPPADGLEVGPDEELVEVIDRDGFTEVVKKHPCAEGCEECPHGPYLYRIRLQPSVSVDDSPSLHWEFLGRVYDD